jgi:hypothetical protein
MKDKKDEAQELTPAELDKVSGGSFWVPTGETISELASAGATKGAAGGGILSGISVPGGADAAAGATSGAAGGGRKPA